jgi:hypothetical protein
MAFSTTDEAPERAMIDEAPDSVLQQRLLIPDDAEGARSINAAIVGIPNAGKSVLLNHLVNSQVRPIELLRPIELPCTHHLPLLLKRYPQFHQR